MDPKMMAGMFLAIFFPLGSSMINGRTRKERESSPPQKSIIQCRIRNPDMVKLYSGRISRCVQSFNKAQIS